MACREVKSTCYLDLHKEQARATCRSDGQQSRGPPDPPCVTQVLPAAVIGIFFNTLVVTVPRLVHVITFVHTANRLVKITPVESPNFAHHVVDEVVNPILVRSVDVSVANQPAKRIVACCRFIYELDEH
jgi:hypothetical protein